MPIDVTHPTYPNNNDTITYYGNPTPGPGHTPSYQTSGVPFLSSSLKAEASIMFKLSFPYVSKFVTVKNTGLDEMYFGFSSGGVTTTYNRIKLAISESYTGEFRVTDVYLWGDGVAITGSVAAGLTFIPSYSLNPPNWNGSVGVGTGA